MFRCLRARKASCAAVFFGHELEPNAYAFESLCHDSELCVVIKVYASNSLVLRLRAHNMQEGTTTEYSKWKGGQNSRGFRQDMDLESEAL